MTKDIGQAALAELPQTAIKTYYSAALADAVTAIGAEAKKIAGRRCIRRIVKPGNEPRDVAAWALLHVAQEEDAIGLDDFDAEWDGDVLYAYDVDPVVVEAKLMEFLASGRDRVLARAVEYMLPKPNADDEDEDEDEF